VYNPSTSHTRAYVLIAVWGRARPTRGTPTHAVRCKNDKKGEGGDEMIKRIAAAVAVGAIVVSGAVYAIGTASAAPTGKGLTTETVQLSTMARSGATGTALFTYNGKTTTVKLTVRHLKAMSVHPAHIHVARCSNPGRILYPFPNVHAGRNGIGVVRTSFAGPFAGKRWSVNVHVSSSDLAVIACGNVR
jgi:hypothetical protein